MTISTCHSVCFSSPLSVNRDLLPCSVSMLPVLFTALQRWHIRMHLLMPDFLSQESELSELSIKSRSFFHVRHYHLLTIFLFGVGVQTAYRGLQKLCSRDWIAFPPLFSDPSQKIKTVTFSIRVVSTHLHIFLDQESSQCLPVNLRNRVLFWA